MPYVGVLLADILQIHHENPTYLENGFLNIQKISKIGKKLKQLQTFQRRFENYQLSAVNWIQEAITNATSLTEHQISRLSNLHIQEQAESSDSADARPVSPALSLTERDWALLFGGATLTRYQRAHVVLAEGEFSPRLFRVKSGRLRMEKRDVNGFYVKTGTVEALGMFGEFSFLGANASHRFAVESPEAELWTVEVSHLSALFAVQPKLCAKFYRIFAVSLANKLASYPVSLEATLECIGNTGNFQMWHTDKSTGDKGVKSVSKVDQEFRQEFQLADEYVIKGANISFLSSCLSSPPSFPSPTLL